MPSDLPPEDRAEFGRLLDLITPQQRETLSYYLADIEAGLPAAALRAGYAPSTAANMRRGRGFTHVWPLIDYYRGTYTPISCRARVEGMRIERERVESRQAAVLPAGMAGDVRWLDEAIHATAEDMRAILGHLLAGTPFGEGLPLRVVQAIEFTERGDGTRQAKLKLVDKIAAIRTKGQWLGYGSSRTTRETETRNGVLADIVADIRRGGSGESVTEDED